MSRRWWTFSSVRSIHMVDSLDPSRLAGICHRNGGPNEGSRLHWLPAPCYFIAQQLGGWGFPSRKVRDVFLGDVNVTEKCLFFAEMGRTSQGVKGVAFYSWLHDYILQSLWNQASPCVQYLHISSPNKAEMLLILTYNPAATSFSSNSHYLSTFHNGSHGSVPICHHFTWATCNFQDLTSKQ